MEESSTLDQRYNLAMDENVHRFSEVMKRGRVSLK